MGDEGGDVSDTAGIVLAFFRVFSRIGVLGDAGRLLDWRILFVGDEHNGDG